MLHDILFPTLAGHTWAEVNLNAIALMHDAEASEAATDEHWVSLLHQMLEVDHSWGGWMEGRHHLLRNQYHKNVNPDHFWHLGIDYNVPSNTPVHLPVDGELIHAEMDPDRDGGWGGKLIFKIDDGYLILGHLNGIVMFKKPYKAGEPVAVVGDRTVNGNWFPHLHVQCMKKLDVKVDGYSHRYGGMEEDFPNPVTFLRVSEETMVLNKEQSKAFREQFPECFDGKD